MKKIAAAIIMLVVIISAFFIGTGFQKRTDVVLFDYSVSEDGTAINLGVQVSSSMGYVRGFKNKGGGVKPHYLTFYSTFGGLNSSFGTVNSFVLEIEEDDTEIYFNRPDGGYELVLIKSEETGEWIRPGEDNTEAVAKKLFTIDNLISLCDEGSEALKNAMTNFNEDEELPYSNFEKHVSEHSLTWDYFCYVQYEDREYRIQASYWKPEIAKEYGHEENELDFVNIFYPSTNDGLLLYEADERFTPSLDIRSFLEKEYDLSLEVELNLPEGLALGNYQMDLVMGQGCLFEGDYEEESHGEGTPKDWYVFLTEENDENVYTLFLNQKYFEKEDVIELARSVMFK